MKLISFLFIFTFSVYSFAADQGFRYVNGKCVNAQNKTGLNKNHFGQCSDMQGATLGNLNLDGVDFSGSVFKNANLEKTSLAQSILVGVSFELANLTGVQFDDAQIENTSFYRAILRNASFFDAKIASSVFSSSDLTAMTLSYAQIKNSSLNTVNLSGAQLSEIQLINCEVKNSRFIGADLTKANLSGSNFSNSDFENAQMSQVNLQGTNLTSANLKSANLTNAITKEASFIKAIVNKKTILPFSKDEALKQQMVYSNTYQISGVARNLKLSDLEGWKICHQSTYGSGSDSDSFDLILNNCKATSVMLACRQKDSPTLILAAAGKYEKVFLDIGLSNTGTLDNNVLFYYGNAKDGSYSSIGFAPANTTLNRYQCDVESSSGTERLCFHTRNNALAGGYRCGENSGLNEDNNYERLFLKSDDE